MGLEPSRRQRPSPETAAATFIAAAARQIGTDFPRELLARPAFMVGSDRIPGAMLAQRGGGTFLELHISAEDLGRLVIDARESPWKPKRIGSALLETFWEFRGARLEGELCARPLKGLVVGAVRGALTSLRSSAGTGRDEGYLRIVAQVDPSEPASASNREVFGELMRCFAMLRGHGYSTAEPVAKGLYGPPSGSGEEVDFDYVPEGVPNPEADLPEIEMMHGYRIPKDLVHDNDAGISHVVQHLMARGILPTNAQREFPEGRAQTRPRLIDREICAELCLGISQEYQEVYRALGVVDTMENLRKAIDDDLSRCLITDSDSLSSRVRVKLSPYYGAFPDGKEVFKEEYRLIFEIDFQSPKEQESLALGVERSVVFGALVELLESRRYRGLFH